MAYKMSEKVILHDLRRAKITWGMQLEMARKYNQGNIAFAELGANSRQRAWAIVNRINKMDTELLEKITRVAIKYGLF